MLSQPQRLLYTTIIPRSTPFKEPSPTIKKELLELSDRNCALLIDYGSELIKAGYDESHNGPNVVFRSQVTKTKDLSKTDQSPKQAVNTSYDQLDFSKSNYKTPFERNIILHFGLLEQCNDYIFSELIRSNKRIRGPVIISQPFANLPSSRCSLLQQLFQCYQIQSVMIGVSSLFAYFYQLDCNLRRYETQTALLIQIGANTIHIFNIIDGIPHYRSIKRINLGGNQAFELFAKQQILKYPYLKNKLTYGFLRDIFEQYTAVAIDYRQQLKYFQRKFKIDGDKTIYRNRIDQENKEIDQQLHMLESIEIDFDLMIEVPEEEIKRKEQMKKRMAEKLRQTISRRKEAKRKLQQVQLKEYLALKEKYEQHDKFAHEEVVEIFGQHHPHVKLDKKIKELETKLGLGDQKTEQNKYNLLNVPDNQLPPQKLRLKKMQMYQKQAVQMRQLKQRQREQQQAKLKQLRQNNPQIYLQQLKQRYKVKVSRMKENERIKNELNNRKSKLKQRKMQAMARLAEDEECFGENEDDWLACEEPQESDHYSEIEAMELQLRQIDPEWMQVKDVHGLREEKVMRLLVDRVKCHEIYFDPKIIGISQCSLIETIMLSIAGFDQMVCSALLSNVIVIGGASVVPGLKQRLQRDLRRQCPNGTNIRVTIGKGGSEGAFLGMQAIARNQQQFLQKMSFKRQDYFKNSQNYFVGNPWSNPASQ